MTGLPHSTDAGSVGNVPPAADHLGNPRGATYTRLMAEKYERRTIHFAGQVQGVGFRYTTTAIAQNHTVHGFVQNLPDGRVLLVAEGQAAELDTFVAAIRERLGQYIRQELTDRSAPTREFTDFGIRHG